MRPLSAPGVQLGALLVAFTLAGACARPETDTSDTAAGAVSTDTGMAGMEHSSAAADRGPARDADHEFLRMMSDHHEGLIAMASAAMSKGSTSEIQGDAHEMHTKQEQELKQMVDMIRSTYGENLQPSLLPSNRAMIDSLQQKSGTDYDRAFYRMIVQHHREAIRMMDEFQPRVQRAEVRQMIDRMRADQQREIREFEAKLARMS